jgi:UDP-GlcNAc:undecaprenyl-phosphate/decaprenyl-phosphate GlcNAc-1-phosphate transferase
MNQYYIYSFIIPFILSIALLPVVRKFAFRIGFVDLPGEGKNQLSPVPLGGGILLFLGFLTVFMVLTSILNLDDFKSAVGIAAGSTFVMLIGLYHDALNMGAMQKLSGQVISALIFLAFAQKTPPVVSVPVYFIIAIIWIVLIQNSFNFLDNMDGLCGGISFTISVGLGILFILKEMPLFAILSFALAGGALGFLKYNLPPAGVYLGDSGSLFFGYAIACLSLVHFCTSKSLLAALSPLIIVAYPIFDLVFVTFSRLNESRNVYLGGFDSSAHKITFLGLTKGTTLLVIQLINVALVAIGIAVFFLGESPYQVLLLIILTFILAFIGTHLYRSILFLRYRIFAIIVDLAAVNLTLVIYVLVRFNDSMAVTGFAYLTDFIVPMAWINLFWIVTYSAGGLYDLSYELKFRSQLAAIVRLALIGFLIFAAATYQPGKGLQASVISLLIFAALLIAISTILRLLFSKLLERYRSSKSGRLPAVVIAMHPTIIVEDLSHYQDHYDIKGYFGKRNSRDLQYLGEIETIGDYLRENKIARVILDIASDNYDNLNPVFGAAFYMETRFLISNPDSTNLRGLRKMATRYGNIAMISLSQRQIFVRFAKRLSDFVISGILLFFSIPYFAFRFTLDGFKPLSQNRRASAITKACRECELWGAYRGGVFCHRNIWGLISVLKGDLSLVGTTVTLRSDLENSESNPGIWRKFLVRPGMFGPGYDFKSPDDAFKADLHYAENATILYDVGILLRQMTKILSIRKSGSA